MTVREYPDVVHLDPKTQVSVDLTGRPIVWLSSGQELKFNHMGECHDLVKALLNAVQFKSVSY